MAEYGGLLSKVAHAQLSSLVNGQICKFVDMAIVVLEEDATLVGLDESHDHIERGCLTRSVRAEQTDNFALLNIYGHMVHDRACLIFFDKVCSVKPHTTKIFLINFIQSYDFFRNNFISLI